MSNRFRWIVKHKRILIYITFFLLLMALHYNIGLRKYDDSWFYEMSKLNIFDYLNSRFETWTSRLIIEGTMIIMMRLPIIIWKILDSLMFLIILYSIEIITDMRKSRYRDIGLIFTIIIIMLIPFRMYGETGWCATTLNYLWPIAMGLYTLTSIKLIFRNEKITILKKITFVLSALYASNQEQMCAILFGFFIIYSYIYYVKNKQISFFMLTILVIIIIMLVFSISCPGNISRNGIETQSWYPEYENFNLISKLLLGIVSTISVNCMKFSFIIVILLTLLAFVTIRNNKKIGIKILSVMPLIIWSSIFINKKIEIFTSINMVFNIYLNPQPVLNIQEMLIISLFGMIFIGLVMYLIYLNNSNNWQFICLIILAGICSKVIMGYSPTIYASGLRTNLFFYYALVVSLVLLILNYFESSKGGSRAAIDNIFEKN